MNKKNYNKTALRVVLCLHIIILVSTAVGNFSDNQYSPYVLPITHSIDRNGIQRLNF